MCQILGVFNNLFAFFLFRNPPRFISRNHSLYPDISSDKPIILSLRSLFCFDKTNFIYSYVNNKISLQSIPPPLQQNSPQFPQDLAERNTLCAAFS